jgi:pantothenate kinase
MAIGADIGALTVTLASQESPGCSIKYAEFPLSDRERLIAELRDFQGQIVPSVGSGAWRLASEIESQCSVLIEKHREPVCVWAAIRHLLETSDIAEAYKFTYVSQEDALYPISAPFREAASLSQLITPVVYQDLCDSFPILLVNVKTGTSIYRVDSPSEFVRVGGASIGSSTVTGLGQALAPAPSSVTVSVTSVLSQSQMIQGHHCRTDLLVEDIYGGDCDSIGLPGSIIASCFGKADEFSTKDCSADLAKSLIDLICINTAQLTHLHAQLNGCTTAVIVGSIGGSEEHLLVSECIQRVLNILNKSTSKPIHAVFLKQSKFLGCLGAMLIGDKHSRKTPCDTATISDLVVDETYTKLRVSTPPLPPSFH